MSINDKVSMFYNAKPQIFENAKILRGHMTEAEQLLWEILKNKGMQNLRFRAQHPIDIFVADFYCHQLKLIIEVDGEIHELNDQKEYDIGREAELNEWGIKVIRFTNEAIKLDINHVRSEIDQICTERRMELQSPL